MSASGASNGTGIVGSGSRTDHENTSEMGRRSVRDQRVVNASQRPSHGEASAPDQEIQLEQMDRAGDQRNPLV